MKRSLSRLASGLVFAVAAHVGAAATAFADDVQPRGPSTVAEAPPAEPPPAAAPPAALPPAAPAAAQPSVQFVGDPSQPADSAPAAPEAHGPKKKLPSFVFVYGLQWFLATGKVMTGPTFRLDVGRWYSFGLEATVLVQTLDAPSRGASLLGTQLGLYPLLVRPISLPWLDLVTGLGWDAHFLWAVNLDESHHALGFKAEAHVWPARKLGLFAGARAFPLATKGLELGTTRDFENRVPVLFAFGVEGRLL